MISTFAEPPERQHRIAAPNIASGSAKPAALARILTSCPGVTLGCDIAVVGTRPLDYQLELAAHGFARATAASPHGAPLLRDRYGCLCVMDQASDRLDAAALAALRRRLVPAGTLILDVSAHQGRADLEVWLRAAQFRMLQYRVIGLRQPDGGRRRAVFLVARAPRSPLREVPAGAQLATLIAPVQRAA